MGFFQNICKPVGLGGKIMLRIMDVGQEPLSKWGLSQIRMPDHGRILDVGCGSGNNVRHFLDMCPAIYVAGIDYSPLSVRWAREKNARDIQFGRCQIREADVMRLPFPPEEFRLVTAFETTYFWPDLQQAFLQIYRVLQSGGTFMICNECSGDAAGDEMWTGIIKGMALHSSQQLHRMLTLAGFHSIRTVKNKRGWLCMIAEK